MNFATYVAVRELATDEYLIRLSMISALQGLMEVRNIIYELGGKRRKKVFTTVMLSSLFLVAESRAEKRRGG